MIDVTAGQTYTFSAYIYLPSTNTADSTWRAQLYFWNGTGYTSPFSGTTTTITRGNWTRLSVSATVPSGYYKALPRILSTTFLAVGQVAYVDAWLLETGSTLLPYFDGTYAGTYTGYTLTSQQWNGTANASTAAATFRPEVIHKTTQLRLGGLTDFSFPYRFGGRFYLGFATVQRTATGSGQGAESALRLIKRLRTATGSGQGTETASRLIKRFRTATGSGQGAESASRLIKRFRTATGSGQGTDTASRLITRFRTAAGSGQGAETAVSTPTARRTATGSGQGTESSVRVIIKYATATGLGTGASANTIRNGFLRTGYGSGGATASDNATSKLIAYRTATGNGIGGSSVSYLEKIYRTATGSGIGTSETVLVHVVIRTATSSGQGTESAARLLVSIRSATGSGFGDASSIGAKVVRVLGSASGDGSGTADWTKSHIFRVPYTDTYPGGYFGGGNSANRLRRYDRSNVRGLNLYKLTDGSYTTVVQRDQGQIAKLWHGGRDHFLTDEEVSELTEDGFGAYIT